MIGACRWKTNRVSQLTNSELDVLCGHAISIEFNHKMISFGFRSDSSLLGHHGPISLGLFNRFSGCELQVNSTPCRTKFDEMGRTPTKPVLIDRSWCEVRREWPSILPVLLQCILDARDADLFCILSWVSSLHKSRSAKEPYLTTSGTDIKVGGGKPNQSYWPILSSPKI